MWPAPDHPLAQPRESLRRDAAGRQAVLLEDVGERERGARRRVGLAPVLAPELARDRLDLGARVGLGGARTLRRESCRRGRSAAVKLTQPNLSDSRRSGIEAAADDELGRAAADVDDEPRLARRRQHVRDAEVDEARFLVPGDDVDRKAERRFRLRQELRRVVRDAKRVGGDCAHGGRMQAAQPFAEAREAGERRALRLRRQMRP